MNFCISLTKHFLSTWHNVRGTGVVSLLVMYTQLGGDGEVEEKQ
jgi:hypothetical protein